jgi:hypothetical protein
LKEEEIQSTVAYIQSLATVSGDASPVVAASTPTAGSTFNGPPEAARGRDLFFESNRCGTCHALRGKGTAVGPDVTKVPQEQLATAIRSTQSRQVRMLKLKDGESFPAIVGAEDGGFVQVFDLTTPPPVRRTLAKSEIESLTPAVWSHLSVAGSYTPEQLADILAFVRWVAVGAGSNPLR